MTFVAPRAYRGGVEEMLKVMATARGNFEPALEKACAPGVSDDPWGIAHWSFDLGLLDLWEGRADEARHHLVTAAEATLRTVGVGAGWDTPDHIAANTQHMVQGAIAAGLTGRTELSKTLLEKAALFGAGVLQPEQALEPDDCEYIHDPTAENPLHHAYALIRLGRFTGIRTAVYTVPWPEAKRTRPVWIETDVRAVLQTAEIVMASSRSVRTHVFTTEAELSIMLDKLLTCLEHPGDKVARAAAQKRLGIFYDKIAGMGDFYGIYPLVLDLQEAFPHIFKPVVPNPLRTA